MSKFTVTMKQDRETKGALRFHEIDNEGGAEVPFDKAKIGQLYVRKISFEKMPALIRVTVES